MRTLIAVTLAGCLLACTHGGGSGWQSTTHERDVTTGAGNTGPAGTAAAGPSMNSQSTTEAAREAERR